MSAADGRMETLAIHGGRRPGTPEGAIVEPLQLATTFARPPAAIQPGEFVYSRLDNPNRQALERRLAALEGGGVAAAFASGSAATFSLLQTLAAGEHVIAPQSVYFGIRQILADIMARLGLETSFVDMTRPQEVARALRPATRLVLIETPSNPLLQVSDIQAIVALARGAGAALAVDNTIATPVFQRPLELGADYVIHATTKYLGGHSDALGGVIVAAREDERFERLRLIQRTGGAVPSPFDCWLMLRGIETLPLRMRAHAHNARQVAQFLTQHRSIERTLWPGLVDDPGHASARRQMSGYGSLMSILVRGGAAEAQAVAARARLFAHATSFGGTHSLVEHRGSIEKGGDTPPNLLRLSIGLEHADDLIADLGQALRA